MTVRNLLIAPVTSRLAAGLLAFVLRLALAAPFWLSGRTKVAEGTLLTISDTTYTLFEEEYSAVPLPAELAAIAATYAEHLLPVLLVGGLGTRAAALGLLAMTMVIQLFVYPDAWWQLHLQWVALAIGIMVLGPGRLSLDSALFANKTS